MPYMIIALVTLPNHVAANAAMTLPFPRAARKLPRATTVSAGIGGKTFSIAATAARATYNVPIGSDVSHIFSEILPALVPGVHVHFHDVFYPFEYPPEWVYGGRAWSEAYLLRAFLSYNRDFAIVLFNTFLEQFHREMFASEFPLCLRNTGGSIWIRRETASVP